MHVIAVKMITVMVVLFGLSVSLSGVKLLLLPGGVHGAVEVCCIYQALLAPAAAPAAPPYCSVADASSGRCCVGCLLLGPRSAQRVVAVHDGGVEVEALAHAGEEEGAAGVHVELHHQQHVRVEGVHPLQRKGKGGGGGGGKERKGGGEAGRKRGPGGRGEGGVL